jgi:methionyl aminopeptidase
MTILTDEADLRRIREAGKVVRDVLLTLGAMVAPGVSTKYLNSIAERVILESGAEPAFKGYKGYPATICASVNEVIVHGIPSEGIVLKEGDIIGIDVGARKSGFYADAAKTFAVGKVSDEARKLMETTELSLYAGIKFAVAGNRLSDISNAVQSVVNSNGFKEVRAFVGHGIGRELHEPPEVPNFGEKGRGPILKEGLLLAIEPMVNAGKRGVKILSDGWTAVTEDGRLSAHFEHTVMVGREKAEVIT